MRITLSIDDLVVERAREVARQQGISLDELIRNYLQTVAGKRSGEDVVRELEALWDSHPGRSDGTPLDRSEAYEARIRSGGG